MKDIITRSWLGISYIAIIMSVILFGTAGTLNYWQAWIYLAIFFGAAVSLTLYLIKTNLVLLKRRLKAGPTAEKRKIQKIIMFCISIEFVFLLIVPALDYRFGWSSVPLIAIIVGNFLVVIGFYIIFLVHRENTYSSAIIEITQGQTVVSTGPYATVRHPMYAGAIFLLIGTPLALSSFWGLLVALAMIPFLMWRSLDEEAFLERHLPGYADYQKKVIWRLIPYIF